MNKTRIIAFILFAVAGVALAIGLILNSGKTKEEEAPAQNVYAELPEAEDREIPASKSRAYMTSEGNRAKIEDYWDECLPDKETLVTPQNSSSGGYSAPKSASTEDLLGINDASRHSPAPSRPSNPYRETPAEREARHKGVMRKPLNWPRGFRRDKTEITRTTASPTKSSRACPMLRRPM